jgi:hypothetical protein
MPIASADSVEPKESTHHRFLDEAGDTTFYGAGRRVIIGEPGVSKAFYLGCVKFRCPLDSARMVIEDACQRVLHDPALMRFSSVQKRIAAGGFYFHAKDDPQPVRSLFFDAIHDLSCSLEVIVARKNIRRFELVHQRRPDEFYADILGHLLKGKLQLGGRMVLNVAQRGSSTRQINLDRALNRAKERALKRCPADQLTTRVVFNVQNPRTSPLLAISDYLSWTVQRVFETGDVSFYERMMHKISVIQDIYDREGYHRSQNWYGPKRPLTSANKISPPAP